jgi:hypothetical protein
MTARNTGVRNGKLADPSAIGGTCHENPPAGSRARRLSTPPGPVSVINRTPPLWSSERKAAISLSRPISGVGGVSSELSLLHDPIPGHDTARDGFRAFSRSPYNWMEMHPVVRRGAVAGTALGLLAALRRRP